jgi:thymidylate synthase
MGSDHLPSAPATQAELRYDMKQYLDILTDIMTNGRDRGDRTGTGTRGVFGRQLRFDLRDGFPLLTTKKMFVRGIVHELLWILSGSTNVKPLQDADVHIWDAWATAEQCAKFGREAGDLGPVYGHVWRNFGAMRANDPAEWCFPNILPSGYYNNGVDQIMQLTLFQFYVQEGELSCQLYQRSADCVLGVPFNIASYALLTMMIAQVCDLRVGEFVHTFGDAHIYQNHFDQVREQLSREPRPLPRMVLYPGVRDIFEFQPHHFKLEGYDPHPAIRAEVSV